MALEWMYSSENVDWEELSALYLAAPLGQKDPADLKIAFTNSMFKCFVYDSKTLVAAGRALADGRDCSYIGREVVSRLINLSKDHKKIILYAAAGKEPFYRKLGFKRMITAMAIFKNEGQALKNGVIADD